MIIQVELKEICRVIFLISIISTFFQITTFGQEFDPKITISVKDMPLGQVLQILDAKTSYTFSYLNKELPLETEVTLETKNKPLKEILNILSKKCALSFSTINKIIIVKYNDSINIESNERKLGTLRGIVQDSLTSEVLPFANVYVKELATGTSTDARGYFVIPSMPVNKKYTIIITFMGYTQKVVEVKIRVNMITQVEINMEKSTIALEDVVVTGKSINDNNVTTQKISIKDIKSMSTGVETDVLRSIQILPGVQSVGDVSARYYVRGGASNENLLLLNNTPIYNPFHALGMFSVVDPELINGVEFSKGGFSAKYGGRLSSVMDIITKEGNKNNYSASANVSQLTYKAAIEGPIPDGSFIVTGRKSYSTSILDNFTNNQNVPIDFYDASTRISYNYNNEGLWTKLTAFGFISNDRIENFENIDSKYEWANYHFGLNAFSVDQNSPFFADFTLYYSVFRGKQVPATEEGKKIENMIYDFSVKGNISYVLDNRNQIYTGFDVTDLTTKLILQNNIGNFKNVGDKGFMLNSFGGFKLLNFQNIEADFSTRLNIVNLSKSVPIFFEPRISFIYNILPTLSIKGAWGIYQQELVTISDENDILSLFEPWFIVPEYLKPSSSIHYISGINYYLTSNLILNFDIYYKIMHNLAILNDNVIKPTDPQLINGSGKSKGAEMMLSYSNKWMNSQISYSYSNTTKKTWEKEYHPKYDSRNAVKIFLAFELGNNWSSTLTWNYNSGMPFTQIYGYGLKFVASEKNTSSIFDNNYKYYPIFADKNAGRLPDYHRLDISISKEIKFSFLNIGVDFSLTNVYDRKNFFYFNKNTGERVNMLPFFPAISVKVKL